MAAHFLRQGTYFLTALSVVFPFLLLIQRRWATRIVQITLLLVAAIWAHTLLIIAHERLAAGEPWVRMAVILGSVMVLALVAALLANKEQGVSNRKAA